MTGLVVAGTLISLSIALILWFQEKQRQSFRQDTVRQELWQFLQYLKLETEYWLARLPASQPSYMMQQEVLKRLAGVEHRLRKQVFSLRREQSQLLRADALHQAAVRLAHANKQELPGGFEAIIAQELLQQAEQLFSAVKAHGAALPSIKLSSLSSEISVARRAFLHGDNGSACWHAEQSMRLAREIGNQIAQAHTQAIEKVLRGKSQG